ncbi:hypothetical protein GCK72_015945 [Caenorhabditis remanei]|uniref:Uncharacterized protein n=1 Tax=Caenorhabditis remanei TaxID=31234 RepID=A0A6A5GVH7_CAERE|nr:hypothetical protein GCK72_015945 [Caenorhabditis remanei]KAF1759478.1 hypothetical protein GCK72_015945 [Caenorhabditis remanei]
MTVNITTDTDFVPHPQKTEANTSAPIVAETMQHADVKLSKVLFTGEGSSQVLLLGKGRGRCVALWERDDGIDPFRILSIKNSEVDPNDACKMPENRVCVGYADGSLAVFNTAKEDLTLMSRIPSVHDGSASRAICRNGNGVLSASSNGTLSDVDVETGKARTVFSGQAGIRSICTSFGSNVVTAGDSNGQITIWDLRENNGEPSLDPIKLLIPSKKALDAVSSLCTHPAQSNLICCGTDDGIVGLIDARNVRGASITSTYLVAKKGITQTMFHPTCADSLLVSANDGSLIRIDASAAPIAMGSRSQKDVIWLEGELANSLRLDPIRNESIFPISSFDIHSDTVVAASSIGMVSLYQQLPFYPNNTVFGRV